MQGGGVQTGRGASVEGGVDVTGGGTVRVLGKIAAGSFGSDGKSEQAVSRIAAKRKIKIK